MVYDQVRRIRPPGVHSVALAAAGRKGRGGWSTPRSMESFMPRSWRATRSIHLEHQEMQQGNHVDDYGISPEDYFVVKKSCLKRRLFVGVPDLVHASREDGEKADTYDMLILYCRSLILQDIEDGREREALLHPRCRGRIAATGIKRIVIIVGESCLNSITTQPMLAGLAERAEAH